MSPHENFSRYSQSMNEHPHVIQAKNDLRYTRKYSNATDSSSTSKFRPPSGRFNSDTSYVKNPFMNKKTYPFDSEDEKSLNINDNNDFHNKSKIKKTKHLKYGYDNYEILDLEIKLPKETKHLKILRYDDLFEAVVTFVKENELKIEMIKPILHNILKSLNGIYCILNSTLNDVDYLASLGRLWEKVKEKADEEYVQKNQRLPCSRSCDKMYREIESSSEKSEEEELF